MIKSNQQFGLWRIFRFHIERQADIQTPLHAIQLCVPLNKGDSSLAFY